MGRGLIRQIARSRAIFRAARAQRAGGRDPLYDFDGLARRRTRPVNRFTDADQARIRGVITATEAATAGEIVAVVAGRSDSYLHVPFLVAALAALLVPLPLIYLTWITLPWIYALQLFVFAVLVVLVWPIGVRIWFVPASVRHDNAHRRAVEQFLIRNLHTTSGRTGVLIFVSLAERHAEILPDQGIDAKVPEGTWQQIVDDLTASIGQGRAADGFVAAIEACGKHLAAHFPPGSADPNERPDHLIVLS